MGLLVEWTQLGKESLEFKSISIEILKTKKTEHRLRKQNRIFKDYRTTSENIT